ncbi:hypothetical protein B6A42_11825 [Vibrio coralliilyticus]|nr:hypothetical protein B6A42_11825 [Vibrio coralliilyticus]
MQLDAFYRPNDVVQLENEDSRDWLVSLPEEILEMDDIIEEPWGNFIEIRKIKKGSFFNEP